MLLTRSALRRAGLLTLAIAAVVALAACSSSDASEPASSTDQGGGTATVTDGAVTITADDLAFDASVIQATAGEDFTLTLVNDDSAFSDPAMPAAVRDTHVPLIVMHMRGTPRTMQEDPVYVDLLSSTR